MEKLLKMKGYKMRLLNTLFITFILLITNSCDSKPKGAVEKMHWDRDMCERCKMAISERKFAVEAIDIKKNKTYKFDDLGCALLWIEKNKVPLDENLKLWITDAKTGEWIDAKSAIYIDGARTPMAYGFASYTKETLPQNHKTFTLDEVIEKIYKREKENTQKVKNQ